MSEEDSVESDDSSASEFSHAICQGYETGGKHGSAPYTSPHSRVHLHLLVPSPADPTHLGTPADFTQRLCNELSGAGHALVSAAVRRGSIELAVDMVMLAGRGTEPFDDAGASGVAPHTQQPPLAPPLQALLNSLGLPGGANVAIFSAGQVLHCSPAPPDSAGTLATGGGGGGGAGSGATAWVCGAADFQPAASLLDTPGPVIDSIQPLCLTLSAAPAPACAGGAPSDAAQQQQQQQPSQQQPPLRVELRGRHLTAVGVTFAARDQLSYLPTACVPLRDGSAGVELLISCPAGRSLPGLIHVECRNAAAEVVSCRPLLLTSRPIAAEVCAALEGDAACALELGDEAAALSVDDLIGDVGAWSEYVAARLHGGGTVDRVVTGAAAVTGDAAALGAAAAHGAATAHGAVTLLPSPPQDAADVLRASLCRPRYRQMMSEVASHLLAEGQRRGWPCLMASIEADLTALGEGPLSASPVATSSSTPAPAAALPAVTRPTSPSPAVSPPFVPRRDNGAPAPPPFVPASFALGGGEVRCALRALALGFPCPSTEARFVQHATDTGRHLATTWLVLAAAFAAVLLLRVLWAAGRGDTLWILACAAPVAHAAWLLLAHRAAFFERREALFLAMGVGRVAARLLVVAEVQIAPPFMRAVCLRHMDALASCLLPAVSERVRLRFSAPLMLLCAGACTLFYVRLGMYEGSLARCGAHAAADAALWLLIAAVTELRTRLHFLRSRSASAHGEANWAAALQARLLGDGFGSNSGSSCTSAASRKED